jgi:hypothetical protein
MMKISAVEMFGCGFITFAVAVIIRAIVSDILGGTIGWLKATVLTVSVALVSLAFVGYVFTMFTASDGVDVSQKPPVIAKPEASRKDPYDFKVLPPGWQQQWKQDDDPRIAALEKRCDIFAREIEHLKASNAELMYRTSALAKLSGRLASLSDKGMEMQVTQAKIIAKLAKEAEHQASPSADTIPQTTKYLCPQPGNPGMFAACSEPLVYPLTVAPVNVSDKP